MEEELHALVVDGLLRCIDHALQHEIGLLQLIPEEEVGLRELDAHGVVLHHIVRAQHIESAEHPAASGRLLVCDRLFTCLDREIGVEGACLLMVYSQRIDAVGGHGIHQGTVQGLCLVGLLDITEHRRGDATCLCLGLDRESEGETECENKSLLHLFFLRGGNFLGCSCFLRSGRSRLRGCL